MHAALRHQSHKMELLPALRRIVVCGLDFGIFKELVVAAGHVDFHKVLIDDPSGAEVEVAHLRVTHLSFRKSHGLAAGLKVRVGIFCAERVDVRRSLRVNGVRPVMLALAPSVEDHKKYFFAHIDLFYCHFEPYSCHFERSEKSLCI